MFFLRGAGLGDYIDQTDPCTANPSDPICQATASDTAADPCTVNPMASYCQASIVQQGNSLPTPGTNDSQWNQFVDGSAGSWGATAAAAAAAIVGAASGGNKPTTPAIVRPGAPTGAGLIGMPSKPVLVVLAVLGGFLLWRRRQQMTGAKKAA